MLSNIVSGPKPTLKIVPYQGIVHLHPRGKYEHLDAYALRGPDETFWGTVVLSLPKAREVTSLVVKLEAKYTLSIPGEKYVHCSYVTQHFAECSRREESGTLFETDCHIAISQKLEKGQHSYVLSIPADCRLTGFLTDLHGR